MSPTDQARLSPHFLIHVPLARAINPITHTNWEGVGVIPDIATPANNALNVALRLALKKAILEETNPAARTRLTREWKDAKTRSMGWGKESDTVVGKL